MNNETDKCISEYFSKKDVVPINEQTVLRLKEKTENVKKNRVNYVFKRVAILSTCLVAILVSILVPVLTNKKTIYYSDTETNAQEITVELAQGIIDADYSKYSFVFEDFSITKTFGIYSDDKNVLLGIRLEGEYNDIPFSRLNFCLAINKNFIPKERVGYIFEAEQENRENYVFYKKVETTQIDTVLCGIMDYDNYSLYIKINKGDLNTFEKFL